MFIKIPTKYNKNGILSFVERKLVPFDIKRMFYIYNIPIGEIRGKHAHKICKQFIISPKGKSILYLKNKKHEKIIIMSPNIGLYIEPMTWVEIYNYSSDTFYIVLTSDEYDENDYIRDYIDFKRLQNES